MKINLHYDRETVPLEIPSENIEDLIEPWHQEYSGDNSTVLRESLSGQTTCDFEKLIDGKRLCVLTDDGTRNEPFAEIFPELFNVLTNAGSILFMICTGTHDADTAENNKIKKLINDEAVKAGITNFEIHTHDCQRDSLIEAGRTSFGTEVAYNKKIAKADVFLVLSDIKVHYFSGYSNPIKNFVPGICSFRTTEKNHSFALDENGTFGVHPWHHDPNRRKNPVAMDQLEGMNLIANNRPIYSLVVITTSGKINWAKFGPIEEVTAASFVITDQKNVHTVKPVSRLVVSPGGFPDDINLYIAQRSLELTKNAIMDNGEILFLSACAEGIGDEITIENFYNRLTAPLDEILKTIESQYKLFSHKPYKFAQLIMRLRQIGKFMFIP
ncbi:MAG: lactate racemase domain-containing protein [Planctomycetota bacterium]|jgi:nickel-dependent lactate racemase